MFALVTNTIYCLITCLIRKVTTKWLVRIKNKVQSLSKIKGLLRDAIKRLFSSTWQPNHVCSQNIYRKLVCLFNFHELQFHESLLLTLHCLFFPFSHPSILHYSLPALYFLYSFPLRALIPIAIIYTTHWNDFLYYLSFLYISYYFYI